jgi:hypothetical protein
MWQDPIVLEVHRIREKLAADFNFDVGAFFADLRKRQTALGTRLVPEKKRAEPAPDEAVSCHSASPQPAAAEANVENVS